MLDNEPKLLNRKQTAEYLGCSVRTVDRMRLKGVLPAPRINEHKNRKWTIYQLKDYLTANK